MLRNEDAVLERFGNGMGLEGLRLNDDATALQIGAFWLFILRIEEHLIMWIQTPIAYPDQSRYEKILSLCDPRERLDIPVHLGLTPNDELTLGATFNTKRLTLPELEQALDLLLTLGEKSRN